MRRIDYIIVHHTAGADHSDTMQADDIRRWHVEGRGWRDLGYHLVVEYVDGVPTAIIGRPWDIPGAHCLPRNGDSLGVAIVGDFSTREPEPELRAFVLRLLDWLARLLDVPPDRILGHAEGHPGHTACPGRYDLGAVRAILAAERA